MKKLFFVTVMVAVGMIATACGPSTSDYQQAASSTLESFMRAYNVAANTPRLGLAVPILSMEESRQEWDRMEVPGCAQTGHLSVSQAMDKYINAFLAFAAQEEDDVVNTFFTSGDLSLAEGQESIAETCGFSDGSVWG